MKQVTRCYNCNSIIRIYGSFIAEIEEELMLGGYPSGQFKKKKIHLCRTCTKEAGYKVHEHPEHKV